MKFEVTIQDAIAYAMTIISIVLFILERKKNSRTPLYMMIQGVLRNLDKRSGFYANIHGKLVARKQASEKTVPIDEYMLFVNSAYAEQQSLVEVIMGSLKSIEPEKDLPFDASEFLKRKGAPQSNDVPNQHGISKEKATGQGA